VRTQLAGTGPVSAHAKDLFIRLIIRLIQFVFSVEIIFFSHDKSVNSVFQPAYQHSQTWPKLESAGVSHARIYVASYYHTHDALNRIYRR
jgi:hypothetical protein